MLKFSFPYFKFIARIFIGNKLEFYLFNYLDSVQLVRCCVIDKLFDEFKITNIDKSNIPRVNVKLAYTVNNCYTFIADDNYKDSSIVKNYFNQCVIQFTDNSNDVYNTLKRVILTVNSENTSQNLDTLEICKRDVNYLSKLSFAEVHDKFMDRIVGFVCLDIYRKLSDNCVSPKVVISCNDLEKLKKNFNIQVTDIRTRFSSSSSISFGINPIMHCSIALRKYGDFKYNGIIYNDIYFLQAEKGVGSVINDSGLLKALGLNLNCGMMSMNNRYLAEDIDKLKKNGNIWFADK